MENYLLIDIKISRIACPSNLPLLRQPDIVLQTELPIDTIWYPREFSYILIYVLFMHSPSFKFKREDTKTQRLVR
jgi:hypothetical protein